MRKVHRLRTADRIFYVTVNLRRSVQSFDAPEFRTMIDAMQGSRARLGLPRIKNPTVRTTLTVATCCGFGFVNDSG